jgi:ring-1,2-phenylacetyl-CoA epoxidase subunit PaaD
VVSTVRAAVAAVVDPELRTVTIEELGILRDVREDASGKVTVTITPTYSGCPAMDVIRSDIRAALRDTGHSDVDIQTVLSPAWSTDMISEAGRTKLERSGIAPPVPSNVVSLRLAVRCPRCGEPDTEEISRFGSTACKALWRCRACGEPFDHVKTL